MKDYLLADECFYEYQYNSELRYNAPQNQDDLLAPLSNAGKIGELIRSFEWSKTPVGSVIKWPKSPIFDDQGHIGGILWVDIERNIGERRLRTLRELAARTNEEVISVKQALRGL